MVDASTSAAVNAGTVGAANTVGAIGSIQAAAAAADKVVRDVMKVEPMVAGIAGMFVPGVAVVQPWIIMAAPYLERALNDIATNNGGDVLNAFMELMQHISAGQPNMAALGPASTEDDPPSASAQGSG